jgi:hypothetical protein
MLQQVKPKKALKMKDFDVSVIGELNIDFILNQIDSFPAIGKEDPFQANECYAGQFVGHFCQ